MQTCSSTDRSAIHTVRAFPLVNHPSGPTPLVVPVGARWLVVTVENDTLVAWALVQVYHITQECHLLAVQAGDLVHQPVRNVVGHCTDRHGTLWHVIEVGAST